MTTAILLLKMFQQKSMSLQYIQSVTKPLSIQFLFNLHFCFIIQSAIPNLSKPNKYTISQNILGLAEEQGNWREWEESRGGLSLSTSDKFDLREQSNVSLYDIVGTKLRHLVDSLMCL